MLSSQFRRSVVASVTVALLAGCSSAAQLAPSASGAPAAYGHQTGLAKGMQRPLGAFALNSSKLDLLRAHRIDVPHVVVPNAARSKWGHVVFVADYLGNVVQEFSAKKGGTVLATISDVVGPQGMDSDRQGNLYVTSQGT
ncbi:MAG TPA: hypothetical protein VGF18_09260, partial [Candidatus Tumulicola sp.]